MTFENNYEWIVTKTTIPATFSASRLSFPGLAGSHRPTWVTPLWQTWGSALETQAEGAQQAQHRQQLSSQLLYPSNQRLQPRLIEAWALDSLTWVA